jgi:NAD(P)-dependent dehydrogenase (short-subunit alcohol dehydrogenase family)
MNSNALGSSSRRSFVGGVGTGIAAAAVGTGAPAVAAQTVQRSGTDQTTKRDPTTEYPRPPFPPQQQPWPGLAAKMTPRPDHGEHSYRGSGRLNGRKALLTGGDSGIGRAAAIAFAREGADVAINYLPAEEPDAREVVELIRAAGRKAVALPGDVRTEAFCRKLVGDAVAQLGGLDILVNNAARQHSHDTIADLTTEDFDWTFKTNVYALFWITKSALPHLGAGSSIINTASVQAYEPSPNLLDYSQTKAAIVAFTKALAKQVAKQGVRVNAVAPGPIWTPLQVCGGQPESELPQFGAQTPYGRAGQPAELAPVYVALASAESSSSTGQVFGASGGSGNP